MRQSVIVHLTTVHNRLDVRIMEKELVSINSKLATAVLYVMDGEGDSRVNDIVVHDMGVPPVTRIRRLFLGFLRSYFQVRKLKPRVVHFHDPELMFVGFLFKLHGIKVVYDVHEDLPKDIESKYYLTLPVRRMFVVIAIVMGWLAGRSFDRIVAATPRIAERFPNSKTVVIQNFPILSDAANTNANEYRERKEDFAYIGGLSLARGVEEMIEAMDRLKGYPNSRLYLAGNYSPECLKERLRQCRGWGRIRGMGWLRRQQVVSVLGRVRAGLVLLHPTQAYLESYPVKLFEYMAAGLPVIASDFPLWRQIIENAGCGLVVDPLNPEAIAEAMVWMLENAGQAEEMGERGRAAVVNQYNWGHEEGKLINVYQDMLATSLVDI